MASLSVRVVSPAKVVFEGDSTSLVAPAWDGEVGILPGHAPFLCLLGEGRLAIAGGAEQDSVFWVSGGVLQVERNRVTVLTEEASDRGKSDHREPPDPMNGSAVGADPLV